MCNRSVGSSLGRSNWKDMYKQSVIYMEICSLEIYRKPLCVYSRALRKSHYAACAIGAGRGPLDPIRIYYAVPKTLLTEARSSR